MSFNTNKIKDSSALKRHIQPFTLLASLISASACFVTPAQAVEFFHDDFERTSLDNSVGYGSGQAQNQMSGWDYYKTTRVWTAGPNGLEIQANGLDGINAKSGKYRVELDTSVNSSMWTKVNLVQGQTYNFKFSYRSRPKTLSTTTNQWQCTFFIFCKWVPVTTTSTTYVGGGVRANIASPSYTTPYVSVGDVANWTDSSSSFVWLGASGEATINFEATGASDGMGTVLDDISLGTNISGSTATVSQAESLKGILPPHVPGLTSYDPNNSSVVTPIVVDKNAAIALGKALFWDQSVGSDQQSCASCHFNAGADNRVKNMMNPGLNHNASTGFTYENTRTGNKSGPNYTVSYGDFPFDPNNDDSLSSQGTFSGTFQTAYDGKNDDECSRAVGSIFHVNGVGVRNVEPRNTPTVINAAYNHRNFFDGRANNTFNGISPFGKRHPGAGVYINTASGLYKQPLNLKNSSLASQATGPVGSDFEMACRSRAFADVGRKLLNRKPLAYQTISSSDSVLSYLPSMIGPNGTYANLIQKAFAPAYWNGGDCKSNCGTPGSGVSPGYAYNHMEANFSMYFGIAAQMYMETLISEDSRFDKWKASGVSTYLTDAEKRGESVFNGQGQCSSCHNGPTMTSAALLQKNHNVVQGMLMQNGSKAVYDEGFYNTAVVPTSFDVGNGGVDPWNNPLSFASQYKSNVFVDSFSYDSCTFEEVSADLCSSNDSLSAKSGYRAAVNGAFKTPTLRNIALTGPYMHNGSMATLEQVVDFYNRGGNFSTSTNPDKHPDIHPLGLSDQQKADLVAFMKTFTDDRVAYEKAPFDHPSLNVPHGAIGDNKAVTSGNYLNGSFGIDEVKAVPAVGSGGISQPLKPFHEILSGGLKGEYFSNYILSGAPVMSRVENINFDWGLGSVYSLMPVDFFSVRWTGKLMPSVSGAYQLQTLSDDGVRVWVNNQLVIDNWSIHSVTTNTSNAINLVAGQAADIKVEYYDFSFGATMRLNWKAPGASTYVTVPGNNMKPS